MCVCVRTCLGKHSGSWLVQRRPELVQLHASEVCCGADSDRPQEHVGSDCSHLWVTPPLLMIFLALLYLACNKDGHPTHVSAWLGQLPLPLGSEVPTGWGCSCPSRYCRATVPLMLGCGGWTAKLQPVLVSAGVRTAVALRLCLLRALQAPCQAGAPRQRVSVRGMGQIRVTACVIVAENTMAAGSSTALWSGCSQAWGRFLVTSFIQMTKQTSSSH